MKKLVTAFALAGSVAVTLCATSTPASATALPAATAVPASAAALPHCWGGTDGGRRGLMWCDGAAGHVRLVTECTLAPWADSGYMWKNAGSFYYENTCWFGAIKVDIYVTS